MSFPVISARAHANLALVKYFGKRNLEMNLPATGSLSLNLAPLTTTTEVCFDEALAADTVSLNGSPASEAFRSRVSRFLDIIRRQADSLVFAHVETQNSFPTAAGLASSASGFAALSLAATQALDLHLTEPALSALARRGSGSAARSVPPGIALWHPGKRADGADSYAQSIANPDDWDLRVVVGVTDPEPKKVGSRSAMEHTRQTSPYYANWIDSTARDLENAISAVERRDFTGLGEISEHSALKMHAAAAAARPGILFFKGATVDAFHAVQNLRASGTEAYFTCDAGPQPKVLCRSAGQDKVISTLRDLGGVTQVIPCGLGGGAHLL